jgi:hypothetical protein
MGWSRACRDEGREVRRGAVGRRGRLGRSGELQDDDADSDERCAATGIGCDGSTMMTGLLNQGLDAEVKGET